MRPGRYTVRVLAVAMICSTAFIGLDANQSTSDDECARTARLQIYSNAAFVEEAGDVVGYELAFQQRKRNSLGALFYIDHGVPNEDGQSVSGKISGKELTMKGNWVLHLIEEPSKKRVVEAQPVEISGTLDSKRFRGTITISGQTESVTLNRKDRIWMCSR
jgi:hypothetical protein